MQPLKEHFAVRQAIWRYYWVKLGWHSLVTTGHSEEHGERRMKSCFLGGSRKANTVSFRVSSPSRSCRGMRQISSERSINICTDRSTLQRFFVNSTHFAGRLAWKYKQLAVKSPTYRRNFPLSDCYDRSGWYDSGLMNLDGHLWPVIKSHCWWLPRNAKEEKQRFN